MNSFLRVASIGAAVVVVGCSSFESNKVDYRSAPKASTLSVPPNLTQLSRDNRYAVIDGAVSATGTQVGEAAVVQTAIATPSAGDVRIESMGSQRWLVVNRPAEKLWEPVKEFWLENGFELAVDQSSLGIMETNWLDSNAKLAQGGAAGMLHGLLSMMNTTPLQDKFRTRLERVDRASTEIFIRHYGMVEVKAASGPNPRVWQPRAEDTELETEFLRRLMFKLGLTPDEIKALMAPVVPKSVATVATANGRPSLVLQEGFDRAWRRIGLTLDRTGFTVEDRDRKQGIYFVRYVPRNAPAADSGLLTKLFSGTPKPVEASNYRLSITSQGEISTVSVLDARGAPEASATALDIVKVLAEYIK